jgi:hypothetical protein
VTLDEIKTRTWERLEESGSSPQRYPSDVLDQYVGDGERFYVARTGCLNTTQTITQTPSTLMYDLEDDCIQVERVVWNNSGTYYPVHPTTARQLDNEWALSTRWIEQVGTRATRYFIFGMNRIALMPLITSGTQSYIIHYQQDVAALTTPASSTPEEDHEFLVNYALARCLLSEGKTDVGMEEYQTYMGGVADAVRRRANVDRVWQMRGRY